MLFRYSELLKELHLVCAVSTSVGVKRVSYLQKTKTAHSLNHHVCIKSQFLTLKHNLGSDYTAEECYCELAPDTFGGMNSGGMKSFLRLYESVLSFRWIPQMIDPKALFSSEIAGCNKWEVSLAIHGLLPIFKIEQSLLLTIAVRLDTHIFFHTLWYRGCFAGTDKSINASFFLPDLSDKPDWLITSSCTIIIEVNKAGDSMTLEDLSFFGNAEDSAVAYRILGLPRNFCAMFLNHRCMAEILLVHHDNVIILALIDGSYYLLRAETSVQNNPFNLYPGSFEK